MNLLIIVIFLSLLIERLIKVYTIKDIKQINDRLHGIMVNNGVIISILLSLFVQLIFIDKVSF